FLFHNQGRSHRQQAHCHSIAVGMFVLDCQYTAAGTEIEKLFFHSSFLFTFKKLALMQMQLRNWWELKKMLKQRYSHLSDEDLSYRPGKEQELLLRLQQKTGKSQEEVVRMLNS